MHSELIRVHFLNLYCSFLFFLFFTKGVFFKPMDGFLISCLLTRETHWQIGEVHNVTHLTYRTVCFILYLFFHNVL